LGALLKAGILKQKLLKQKKASNCSETAIIIMLMALAVILN
jgi:hypothetical protein